MFVRAISLARQYAERLDSPNHLGDQELASEVILRLRQLHWLYQRIQDLERQLLAEYERSHGPIGPNHNIVLVYFNRGLPAEASVAFGPQEQVRLLGESFYQTAHRILVVLDQCQDMLPGLRSIDADGIRRVRNNLIEHANKKGGHHSYTFSVSNAAGLRLRTASRPADPEAYLDQGIHINAREFVSQLEAALLST